MTNRSSDDEFAEIIEEIGISDSDFEYLDHDVEGPDDPDAVDSTMDTTVKIRLNREPYSGIVIRYGRVSVSAPEDEESDEATMNFDYEIIRTDDDPEVHLPDKLTDQFDEFVGRVLHYIILRSFQIGEYKIGRSTDSDRDSEEPPQE